MARHKRSYIIFAGAAGLLLIFLLCLNYLASTLINLESIKENIQTSVSGKIGGTIDYQSIELKIIPFTHAAVHKAVISIPGKASGTVETMSMYPKMMALFFGEVLIDRIMISSPEIRVQIPLNVKESGKGKDPADPGTLKDMLAVFASPASESHSFSISVEDGKLVLAGGDERLFSFQDLEAEMNFSPEELQFTMTCDSSIWQNMSVSADFDRKDFAGKGDINLKGFQPQQLTAYLFPDASEFVGDSHMNLDLTFISDADGIIRAEVQGALPRLTMIRENKEVTLRGGDMKGLYRTSEDRTVLTLEKLGLDYPGRRRALLLKAGMLM
jgi:hypothetical protein